MVPQPYSDKSSLSKDSSNIAISGIHTQTLPGTSSPPTRNETIIPSPIMQEQVLIEPFTDTVVIQEINRMPDPEAATPCYPYPGDIMPFDHSLPEFIKQITNQPNLANLHSLRLKVMSTLISLHRMSVYLPNLRVLDLEGSVLNSLRDIGCNFKNLHTLKVGRCQLESLDGTFGLSSLRELYAQKNLIDDVSPCSNLPHIHHIDVSSNRIRNISYAGFLSVCLKLKSIVFTGNPATEVPDYRQHVRRILPQIEALDGIFFIDEDHAQKSKDPELIGSIREGSDSSSSGVPDFLAIPSNSKNNVYILEEEIFHQDKKNKQAKNLANQDRIDNVDCNIRELSFQIKTDLELQDDSQNLTLPQNRGNRGLLEQAKIIQNRDVNTTQKCASIQKLDKDIENQTKKSSLLTNTNLHEELILSSDFSKCTVLEGSKISSPSFSATSVSTDERKTEWVGKKLSEQSTVSGSTHNDVKAEDMKFESIKKRSSPAAFKSTNEELSFECNHKPSTLTTGLPICGNLTAALRTRKKIQNAWIEKQDYLSQKFNSQSEWEISEEKNLEINDSGNFLNPCMAQEDDLVEKNVLAVSKK